MGGMTGTLHIVGLGPGAPEHRTGAAAGERVALISTGEPGVYGMAARTFALAAELAAEDRPTVELIPGITAALIGAARLGAPLSDDFAVVSLSDLNLEWDTIERRLEALAASGIALCLYNPRSRRRRWQLGRVLALLRRHRDDDTPVGIVTDASREREEEQVTMRTVLIVRREHPRAWWLAAGPARRGTRGGHAMTVHPGARRGEAAVAHP